VKRHALCLILALSMATAAPGWATQNRQDISTTPASEVTTWLTNAWSSFTSLCSSVWAETGGCVDPLGCPTPTESADTGSCVDPNGQPRCSN
jgi:hypothetical protein